MDFVFLEKFFHIISLVKSGAEAIPTKPFTIFFNFEIRAMPIQPPIDEPTKIIFFVFTTFSINSFD